MRPTGKPLENFYPIVAPPYPGYFVYQKAALPADTAPSQISTSPISVLGGGCQILPFQYPTWFQRSNVTWAEGTQARHTELQRGSNSSSNHEALHTLFTRLPFNSSAQSPSIELPAALHAERMMNCFQALTSTCKWPHHHFPAHGL